MSQTKQKNPFWLFEGRKPHILSCKADRFVFLLFAHLCSSSPTIRTMFAVWREQKAFTAQTLFVCLCVCSISIYMLCFCLPFFLTCCQGCETHTQHPLTVLLLRKRTALRHTSPFTALPENSLPLMSSYFPCYSHICTARHCVMLCTLNMFWFVIVLHNTHVWCSQPCDTQSQPCRQLSSKELRREGLLLRINR